MARVTPRSANHVRERREARGLSQLALAAAAGLSRQSVSAIEAGRATPAVDVALRLGRALDARVEELFSSVASDGPLRAELAQSSDVAPNASRDTWPGAGRVVLAHVAGRWIAHPLAALAMRACADGIAGRPIRDLVEVEHLRSSAEAEENVVLMGCAPALGPLAERLNARPGAGRFVWVGGSSSRAIEELARRRVHVAGVHLVDARTGEANVVDVRRHVAPEAVVLVTLARWEAGLVLAPGNPKRVKSGADLSRRGLRLVSREKGSGARRLLDRELARAGLPRERAPAFQAAGHLEVAHAVSLGAADVGVATRDAAIAFGLAFVPLAEERYDLAIPRASLRDPRVQRLLDVLASGAFRRELSALGYDPSSSAERVAEIGAA